MLVLLPNHNITAVNTSFDLFGGLATGTSSGITEKEKEHDNTMSNGSTPLKVWIACSTSIKPGWSSKLIYGDYFTDIPWFAHLGVNEIHYVGDSDMTPHPEIAQLAKAYGITPIFDIEESQSIAPFTNPMWTYSASQLALLQTQLQAIKDAGWRGIASEGLSEVTLSYVVKYLPYYNYGYIDVPNYVDANALPSAIIYGQTGPGPNGQWWNHVKGQHTCSYLEAYWKTRPYYAIVPNGSETNVVNYFLTEEPWVPGHRGMIFSLICRLLGSDRVTTGV